MTVEIKTTFGDERLLPVLRCSWDITEHHASLIVSALSKTDNKMDLSLSEVETIFKNSIEMLHAVAFVEAYWIDGRCDIAIQKNSKQNYVGVRTILAKVVKIGIETVFKRQVNLMYESFKRYVRSWLATRR